MYRCVASSKVGRGSLDAAGDFLPNEPNAETEVEAYATRRRAVMKDVLAIVRYCIEDLLYFAMHRCEVFYYGCAPRHKQARSSTFGSMWSMSQWRIFSSGILVLYHLTLIVNDLASFCLPGTKAKYPKWHLIRLCSTGDSEDPLDPS